ncbi:IS3 family transposase [uncultured Mucilaginibacter sp.]|uniref:IS3 family transposase n=1 Tax=uncultured Mucilaginibacter sp. TaxID=797541 RepID=UPI0025E5B86D|nr:IS3 family transposase [uncultured Mucilaginibacter sp.]
MKMQNCPRGLRGFCRLLGYSPQAYYQYQKIAGSQSLEQDLLIQQVLYHRTFQPRLGCRKLHELMEPFMEGHDMYICRDLLFELLRENDLLIVKRRRSQPQTTDSNHWMKKYPDLIKDIRLSRADELWVSDITYIRLRKKKFAYLSLITDAYSRKIVGFCMHIDLSANGPLLALEMALKGRASDKPLIHHSDRGSQYCCDGYVTLLKSNSINISMTQSGNPKDNAIAERVNGILKQELLEDAYSNINQAQCSAKIAIDIYNRMRPHSSVDMMTPEKAHMQTGPIKRRWRSLFNPPAAKAMA